MPDKRVTLKDIAAALGLSVPAVSMALRGHRQIAEATRERVRAKAAELGDRPDPALRALADYRTQRRSAARRWDRVALLHDWPSPEAWRSHDFYGDWHSRLVAVAGERGIEIEEHWLGAGGERAKPVFRTLRHRGITGLLVAPPALTREPVEIAIPADRSFQVVTFGPEHFYRQFHTVQLDFYENLRLAWSKLWEKGWRRIGLLYQKDQGWRTGQAWRAAFHIEKLEVGWQPGVMMPLMWVCDGPGMSEESSTVRLPRRSASADAALRAEIERVSRMTVEERITAALTLRERFAWIQPEETSSLPSDK